MWRHFESNAVPIVSLSMGVSAGSAEVYLSALGSEAHVLPAGALDEDSETLMDNCAGETGTGVTSLEQTGMVPRAAVNLKAIDCRSVALAAPCPSVAPIGQFRRRHPPVPLAFQGFANRLTRRYFLAHRRPSVSFAAAFARSAMNSPIWRTLTLSVALWARMPAESPASRARPAGPPSTAT